VTLAEIPEAELATSSNFLITITLLPLFLLLLFLARFLIILLFRFLLLGLLLFTLLFRLGALGLICRDIQIDGKAIRAEVSCARCLQALAL
jgi:hypothetical protein